MAEAAAAGFVFVAAGNFGCSSQPGSEGYAMTRQVFAKMAEQSPEVVLGLGGYSHQALMQCWHDDLAYFPALHSAMHNPGFRSIALGDSEGCAVGECGAGLNSTGRAEFLSHFGIREGQTFYSFDHKGVHFLALDTSAPYGIGSAQYNFTVSDLEAASEDVSTKWIVVFFSKPMYQSSCASCGAEGPDLAFRNIYQPLFDRNRVDLVIAGDVPAYERFKPATYSAANSGPTVSVDQITDQALSSYADPRGQIHVTVGTGGMPVRPWSGSAPESAIRVGQTYGFLKVEVSGTGNTLTGSFVDKDAGQGLAQDTFTVTHNGRFADMEHFVLDGQPEVSSTISVPSGPDFQLSQFSLAAWFQTNYDYSQRGNTRERIIVNKGGFNGDGAGIDMNYGIWIDTAGRIQAGFEAQNAAPSLKNQFVSSERAYNDGRWHHAAVTNDGHTLRLFIDGVLATGNMAVKDVTNKIPDNTGDQPFKIGYNSGITNDLSRAFHGGIDDVRVWNRPLSEQEVWAAYTGNANPNGQVLYKPASRPVPNAGPDIAVEENAMVSLSGLASSDPDGMIFSYQWAQVAGPTVTINSATASQLSFTAPSVGRGGEMVTFSLSVKDDEGLSCMEPDLVNVIINDGPNEPLVANAGSDVTAYEGSIVTLNGTGSFDPEGQSLTYFWVQTFGPQVGLDNTASASPKFLVPEFNNKGAPIVMTFLLTISDGHELARDTVSVIISERLFSATGSEYRDYPDSEKLRLKDPFSVSAWFRTSMDTSSLDAKTPIINKGGFGTDGQNNNMNYGIWIDCGALENPDCQGGNRIQAGFESSNGTDVFVTSPIDIAYNTGKWYFVVVTFDGYKLKLYINSVQVDGRTTTLVPDSGSSAPLRLGANSLYVEDGVYEPQFLIGEIDEIGVWDRALSREEVAGIYLAREMHEDGKILYDDLN